MRRHALLHRPQTLTPMPDLILLGPFPPPYGGVAVHMVRLLASLRERGIDAEGVSFGGVPHGLPVTTSTIRASVSIPEGPKTLVHYHTDDGNWKTAVLLGTMWRLRRVPYVITLHSFRQRSWFRYAKVRDRLRQAYDGAAVIVCISDHVRDDVVQWLDIDPGKCVVIPSNLPINALERSQPIDARIPASWRTARVRLIANAGRLVAHDGKDLYGCDVVARAVRRMDDADVGLLIVTGKVVDAGLLSDLRDIADGDPRISIVTSFDAPLIAATDHAHIVVRPTRTEGGPSITLTEAMELGKHAVGSDAVPRPQGAVLFRSEDDADLARILHLMAQDVRRGTMPRPRMMEGRVVERLLDVYQRAGLRSTTKTPADV